MGRHAESMIVMVIERYMPTIGLTLRQLRMARPTGATTHGDRTLPTSSSPKALASIGRRAATLTGMAAVLLGAGAVGPTLALGGPLRTRSSPVASASVVDGSNASISEFPFQVALYDPKAGSPAKGFFCGGVIVSATRVVTAAHCLIGERGQRSSTSEIEVLAGSTYLAPTDPGSVRDPVMKATIDSAYNATTSDYDVGMLRLARPLWRGSSPTLNGHSTIAPLAADAAQAEARSAAVLVGETTTEPVQATISGWGDLAPQPGGKLSYPMHLQKAHVSLVATGICSKAYATIEQQITPRMVCAAGAPSTGRGATDSCWGDSGGPLVANGSTSTSPTGDVLLGLVDFGYGCARPGYPGVYVQVADPAISGFLNAGDAPVLHPAEARPQ
jgi:secreted trypsin-like serine protease